MAVKADITIDIDKQVGELQNLSQIYNARVGDNKTPLTIAWRKNDLPLNLKGLHAYIVGKTGDGSYNNETGKIDFPIGSPVSQFEDDGSGTLDGGQSGLTTLLIPKQMWQNSGLFAGYIGLKSEDGSVFTSKDIWFKVLGNVLDAGVEINYFIGDFDKALAEAEKKLQDKTDSFDKVTAQALCDLKNKYDQEVAAHSNALADDTKLLRDLSETCGSIIAQIKANNVATLDQLNKVSEKIDNRLSKIDTKVETLPDLDSVNKKYPNGKEGLIVTNDGYRAVWDGKSWGKGAAFVVPELSNDVISPSNVSNVSYSQIYDNAIDLNKIKPWGTKMQPEIKGNAITLIADNANIGVIISGNKEKLSQTNYLHFDVNPLRSGNSNLIVSPVKSDGSFGESIAAVNISTKNTINYKLNESDFIFDSSGEWRFLLYIYGTDKVQLTDLSISCNKINNDLCSISQKVANPDYLTTTANLQVNNWSFWTNPDSLQLDQLKRGIQIKQKIDGDKGIWIDKIINPNHDLYVTITFKSNSVFSLFLLKDFSQISDLTNLDSRFTTALVSPYSYTTLSCKVPKTLLKELGITDTIKIMIVSHKIGNIVQIKSLDISNSPGSTYVSKKISNLYDQLGTAYPIQVGDLEQLNQTETKSKVHLIGSKFINDKNGRIINQINVLATKAGTLNFKVGTIDQNGLLVNTTDYSLKANQAGINSLSVNIPLDAGQNLFLDISNGTADLYQPNDFESKIMIQDEDHVSHKVGYEGMILYESDGAIPFEFIAQEKSNQEKLDEGNQKITNINEKLDQLTNKVTQASHFIISDDKGFKYQLTIQNDSVGLLRVTPRKVAIFGNSLTCATGEIGMCASDSQHDYYHYLTDYIKSKNPNVEINPRTNVATWEQSSTTIDREKVFDKSIKPMLAKDTDLVIIQLGENANNVDRRKNLEHDSEDLIQEIKSVSPNAKIYWVYGWFGNYQEVFTPIQNACDAEHITGIDIRDLNIPENYGHMGQEITGLDGSKWKVTNPGAVNHPGDRGHKLIAERIISKLLF